MRINSISNQNVQNRQSFKSTWYDSYAMRWVVNVTDGVVGDEVKFMSLSLGHSPAILKIETMVRDLGKQVLNPENIVKIRGLFSKAKKDIGPLSKEYKELIGSVGLKNMDTVVKKGQPKLFEADETPMGSIQEIILDLDPDEIVVAKVPVTRQYLKDHDIAQP